MTAVEATHRLPKITIGQVLGKALSALITTLLLVMLAGALALVAVPKALDAVPLTVLTGSMEPTYMPGDVVISQKMSDPATQIRVGDVVTFQPKSDDPMLITHRVIDKRLGGIGVQFVTQGDNNSAVDEPIAPEQIMGKVRYSVPKVGHLKQAVTDVIEPRAAILGAGALAFLYAIWLFVFADRFERRKLARSR